MTSCVAITIQTNAAQRNGMQRPSILFYSFQIVRYGAAMFPLSYQDGCPQGSTTRDRGWQQKGLRKGPRPPVIKKPVGTVRENSNHFMAPTTTRSPDCSSPDHNKAMYQNTQVYNSSSGKFGINTSGPMSQNGKWSCFKVWLDLNPRHTLEQPSAPTMEL